MSNRPRNRGNSTFLTIGRSTLSILKSHIFYHCVALLLKRRSILICHARLVAGSLTLRNGLVKRRVTKARPHALLNTSPLWNAW